MFQLPQNVFYRWCVQVKAIDTPILQTGQWQCSHTASEWRSWDLTTGNPPPEPLGHLSSYVTEVCGKKHPAQGCPWWPPFSSPSSPDTLVLCPQSFPAPPPLFSSAPLVALLFPPPQSQSQLSPHVPSPKTSTKKTWEDGGSRSHWYWAAGLLLGVWQLRVTLVPTRGTPRRRQDGGAGGTGEGETG